MNKDPILVSVLVLTYNHVRYIRQALESILEQRTTFFIEILVGDDHSSDGTAELIAEFAGDKRIHPVLRQRNVGATRNLYDLQQQARGKYIAYLEGDDYWCDSQKLQKQVNFLESHLEYIGCTHKCLIVDETGHPRSNQCLSWISEKTRYTLQDFHGIILPGHGNTMVHRNVFLNSNGCYKELMTLHPLIGDRSLCLLLASQGDIYQLPEVMSCYRLPLIEKNDNVTTIVYTRNPNRIRDDYEYTKELEAYAHRILKVDGGFVEHKKDIFVSAVWNALKHPSANHFRFAFQVLREGRPLSYLFYLPVGAVRKYQEKQKQGG